ncbi:hypothetical protein IJ472_07205 [bacterium]|nr:hypothetical protein [bacterium]
MGMAASQARLLSITARISNNEMEQQSLAYSKQRLSDNSEQINDAYLDALAKTKYQVLTGYNNSEATYADLTYNQLTSFNSVAAGKQYLVTDNTGKVVVSSKIAEAYSKNNGDFNRFLRDLKVAANGKGLTQADIDITKHEQAEEAIHQAWDKYLASVGKGINNYDGQHLFDFDYTSFSEDSLDGYVTYDTAYITTNTGDAKVNLYKDSDGYYMERGMLYAETIQDDATNEIKTVVRYQTPEQIAEGNGDFYEVDENLVSYNTETGKFIYGVDDEGNPKEYDALYADFNPAAPTQPVIEEDYRRYLTFDGNDQYTATNGQTYTVNKQTSALNYEGTTNAQRELFDYATAITEAYYNNQTSKTTENLVYDAEMINYYKNIFNEMRTRGYTTVEDEKHKFKETNWFVRQLKAGNLQLSYYSTVEKSFVGTSLSSDESIAEKEDSAAMVIAEQVYQNAMDKIERQDKQFDLQLNKLESEHSALTTEYESVKGIIKKNVEKSFNTFNA